MTPHERARALVLEHGRNATSYQILNPGFSLWFNRDNTAVIGYVEYHGVRVVAGIPICPDKVMAAAAAEFENDARRTGARVAYFAVEQWGLDLWQTSADRDAFVIGAQPVWQPAELMSTMMSHRSLRAQLNRTSSKGVVIREWDVTVASESPALRRCLDEWLRSRNLPPLHFLVETNTLPYLLDRRVLVALRDDVVGFLVMAPIAARDGWLIEQNVRGAGAPNGTAESLLFMAAAVAGESSAQLITLGLSPLSHHAPLSNVEPPPLVRALFKWLRMHGTRFYNFEGLDAFKAKFRPKVWEPVYAVIPHNVRTMRALVAMGAAFGGASVIPLALRVMRHALQQEAGALRKRKNNNNGLTQRHEDPQRTNQNY